MDQSNEIWKPVVGYEGIYEVSDQGRVRSLDRAVLCSNGRRRQVKGRVLRPATGMHGHLYVSLWRKNTQTSFLVHRLVLESFVGPAPVGLMCRHLNGDAGDNRPNNLAWGTAKENAADTKLHGTNPRWHMTTCQQGHEIAGNNLKLSRDGKKCRACAREYHSAYKARRSFSPTLADKRYLKVMAGERMSQETKLTEDSVISIRKAYREGETQVSLAGRFGISQALVSSVVRRESWSHVTS